MNWNDFPIGTKAHAINGGHWTKVKAGWKWMTSGGTFPSPGADWHRIEFPRCGSCESVEAATVAAIAEFVRVAEFQHACTLADMIEHGQWRPLPEEGEK